MLYAYQAGRRGPIKIGYSTDPVKRVCSLRTTCLTPIRPLGVTHGTKADEAALMRRLKVHRLHGEWFRPDREVLEVIKTMDAFPPLPEARTHKPPKEPKPKGERKQREITSERIDQSKPASIVVTKAGGLTSFAREYDFPTSTVHSWMLAGLIPSRKRPHPETGEDISYQAYILLVSEKLGHGITAEDFIERAAASEPEAG